MHKILIIAAIVLSLAACTMTQQGAAVGAGAGAVVGAVTTGSVVGTAVGAGIGGVVGAAASNLLGKRAGYFDQCVYQRANGSRYYDTCPKG
ncbi:MAG: YMGG-like glycine zipper-containing protein [Candidatus Devosia symbiotica]|nr:YMGG-like glycine zipper-containing protein [Candidatus Devosia symbiotica]